MEHVFIVLEFSELPTSVSTNRIDETKIVINTDGVFKVLHVFKNDLLDVYLRKNMEYHLLPNGYRYGSYQNVDMKIKYIKDFWNLDIPKISYKDGHKPEMISLREKTPWDHQLTFKNAF